MVTAHLKNDFKTVYIDLSSKECLQPSVAIYNS